MEKNEGGQLVRALGLKESISMTIGTVVGVGLFTCGSSQIGYVGSGIIVITFLSLLISIWPCLIYGEMSAALPCAGGTYNYAKRGLNRVWANLAGWHYIISVVGICLRMLSKDKTRIHVGDILMGFAVLMYGMSAMSGAVSPLRESEAFIRILTSFSNPLLGILVGIAFTSILQSASAAVGILQALSITGAITFEIAFPIIMGIAIGAAVPVLLSALGANLNGRRTAFVYLLIDVLGVVIWSLMFYTLNAFLHFTFLAVTMNAVSIALMNTLFRLATLVVLFPLIGAMEKLVVFLFPDNGQQAEDQDMDRLEERFLQHPALSIEQSRLVTNSMAERAAGNLLDAMALRTDYSDKGFQAVAETESLIDRYEDKLGTYLMKITSRSLSSAQSEEVSKFLHTISDFERISDHALNISETAKEIHDKEMVFSAAAGRELEVMESALREILAISIAAFTANDVQQAARVEPLEEIIDGLCDEMKSHHVDRLQSGACTLNQGFVFNDLLTNYDRIAAHCSNIAVAILELDSSNFDMHEYTKSVRKLKDNNYVSTFDYYEQKYNINGYQPEAEQDTKAAAKNPVKAVEAKK